MQDIREFSIEGLRKESQRPRQDLASTVGDLRDKVGDTATELKTLAFLLAHQAGDQELRARRAREQL